MTYTNAYSDAYIMPERTMGEAMAETTAIMARRVQAEHRSLRQIFKDWLVRREQERALQRLVQADNVHMLRDIGMLQLRTGVQSYKSYWNL